MNQPLPMTRRKFVSAAGIGALTGPSLLGLGSASAAETSGSRKARPGVIASANGNGSKDAQGLTCVAKAFEMITTGAELMRNGMSPKDAGMAALKRVVANTVEKRLLNKRGQPSFSVRYYILNATGDHAGVSMYESAGKGRVQYAVCDVDGPRLVPMEPLFRGKLED